MGSGSFPEYEWRYKMVDFINVFLSYFMLMAVTAAVGGVAAAAGIMLRKRKNNAEECEKK